GFRPGGTCSEEAPATERRSHDAVPARRRPRLRPRRCRALSRPPVGAHQAEGHRARGLPRRPPRRARQEGRRALPAGDPLGDARAVGAHRRHRCAPGRARRPCAVLARPVLLLRPPPRRANELAP
ncbi:hypothetical protein CFC21_022539, partial [Triticum aestivum]